MNVQNDASMAMASMIMYDARQQVMAVQAAPPSASAPAPAPQGADVILSLSTAAQALTSTG